MIKQKVCTQNLASSSEKDFPRKTFGCQVQTTVTGQMKTDVVLDDRDCHYKRLALQSDYTKTMG